MKTEEFEKILKRAFDPDFDFFSEVFFQGVDSTSEELVSILDLKQEALLSFFCDQSSIQDSFRFRSQRRSLLITEFLLNEKGELQDENLDRLIHLMEKEGFIFYPKGLNDRDLLSHSLFVLKKLKEDPNFYKTLLKFRVPLCHLGAEELVCESLRLARGTVLTDGHIRKAVFSACLNNLRQNVGSCFATAPAILIQKEQIENLLSDLYELLMTGKLKRTFAGLESSVPLSPSSGGGDLNKIIPLRGSHFSLGLMAAFESIGLLSTSKSWQEKSEDLRQILKPFLKEKKVRDVVREVLLCHFDLTEEDLILEKKRIASFLKQKQLTMDTRNTQAFQKRQRCELLLTSEKKALSSFKSVTDHALLKAWEFTLASFSEIKMDFSRWNLYASLGFNPEEEEGIGAVIYQALQSGLEENQKKMEEYHQEYLIANDQLRATEVLLKGASTESDIRRLKAEFNSRLYHMRVCLELRDESQVKSSHYSTFFSFLLKQYDERFPEYFQEIYDAEMQDITLEKQYEDSPAGFRLVYKHGRSNAFLWSLIENAEQYIDSLVDFFLAVEPQIAGASDWEDASKILSDLTTSIVTQVRTEEFLKTALWRIAKAHNQPVVEDPISSLEKMEKKPWAYTSGGGMAILLKTYYKRESSLTEESKWVESPSDLLIFILDVLKTLPLSTSDSLLTQPRGLLMSSPSHAFILYPCLDLIKEGWQDDLFTYTWVRDKVILPRKKFYESISLSFEEQFYLIEEFCKTLPSEVFYRLKRVISEKPVNIQTFRNSILLEIGNSLEEFVDSFLYESLPLTARANLKHKLSLLLDKIDPSMDLLVENSSEIISAKKVKECAKALYLGLKGSICLSFDLHLQIAKKSEEIGLAPPSPFLFADTNWTNYYFGFVVNPGTGLLELWRLDQMGFQGIPMTSWKHWLDGRSRATWTLFSCPFEYGFTV